MKGKFTLADRVKDIFFDGLQRLLVGGFIEVRSGAMPPAPSSTPMSGEILVRVPLTWDADQRRAKRQSVTVTTAGTASWARAIDNRGDALWDMDCGPGCSLDLDDPDLRKGQLFVLERVHFFGL
jgi:hypothetical protein